VLEWFFDQQGAQELVEVERLPADEIGKDSYRKAAMEGKFDLIIFERCAPKDEKDLPRANTLFIDHPPPPWQRGKELNGFSMKVASKDHPLMQHVDPNNEDKVLVGFKFNAKDDLPEGQKENRKPPTLTPLFVAGDGVPVVFTIARGPYTDVVLTFPIVGENQKWNTSWPGSISFPFFFYNVLEVLAKGEAKKPDN
jgi:hypothetical protein